MHKLMLAALSAATLAAWALPAQANPDVNLDIGSTVQVPQWQADGTARVPYRGSSWDARHVGGGAPQPGLHVIRAVDGTRLLLERHTP